MTFFYDLNKRLATIADKPEPQKLNEGAVAEADYSAKAARAGKDIGKPGKNFEKIAKSAAERYGSKERGEKVAGAVLAKLRKTNEADMEEGNKFTGNLAKARAAGLKKADLDGDGDMETVRETAKPDYLDLDKDGNKAEPMKKAARDAKKSKQEAVEEGWDDMLKSVEKYHSAKKPGEVERGSKHDIEHTATGRKVTRRVDPQGISVGADDSDSAEAPKRGRGRPAGSGKKMGAKGPSGRSKLMKNEDQDPVVDRGEFDREGDMAKEQLHTIEAAAKELSSILSDEQNLPEWVQSKITKAMDYVDTARDYMLSQHAEAAEEQPVAEKAVSKAQQRFMGMAHAMQKGEKIPGASKELKKVAKTMKKGDVKDFAKTKHKGLPEKKKAEEVEETTVAGSVATSTAEPAKKSKGGITFGKGIYDSLNREVEDMISESMNVSVNMGVDQNGQATKNITINADGEDADQLAQLLNLAGMKSSGCGCGTTPCSCQQELDENSPDWPTEPETTGADDPHLNRWAGGLNKPKETGQTTIPVVNRDPRRGSFGPAETASEVRESSDLGMKLYAELKNFKTQQ